jgi:hypothetical protein
VGIFDERQREIQRAQSGVPSGASIGVIVMSETM